MFLNIGWESKKNTFMELPKWIKSDALKTHITESEKEKFLNRQDNEIKKKLTHKNGNNHVAVF